MPRGAAVDRGGSLPAMPVDLRDVRRGAHPESRARRRAYAPERHAALARRMLAPPPPTPRPGTAAAKTRMAGSWH
jgi:hypothetical protein